MSQFPGIHVVVLTQFARLVSPAAVLTTSLYLLNKNNNTLPIPPWATVLAAITSIPVFHISNAWFRYWREGHKAASLGATMPPRWDGCLPANWDIMQVVQRSEANGFLSDPFWGKMDPSELGPTYDFYVLWDHDYVTSDVSIMKAVLVNEFETWVKGPRFNSYVHSVLGTGVFNSDGEMWKFHRTMTRPFFSREKISHFDLFDKHCTEALAKMKERFNEGYAVDFQDLVARFTLDSATQFLFGHCVHNLHLPLPYPFYAPSHLGKVEPSAASQFSDAFKEAQFVTFYRARRVWLWPWFELFGDKSKEPMRIVDEYLSPIIDEALAKHARQNGLKKQEEGEDEDETLLAHLVQMTTDRVVLHDEVLNIMLAGRDTTAITLTIVVYFLSQHPDVLRRLREEILQQVGSTRRPTYDDVRAMKYLRAVLNESLRLYPAVPWNIRFATKDTVLPNSDPNGKPWFVPAESSVSYSVHCMHRRKDYWGPDAEEFDPDRFLDERLHKYLTPNPFIFLPFNAGPRICLGQQFAYNEMSFFVVRLLQTFESIELDISSQSPDKRPPTEWAHHSGRQGKEKFWPKSHLTLFANGGLWVKMNEAQRDEDKI